jgi:hypothetical protein
MPAHRIIASPKCQAILPLIMLYHKIVSLSSPFVGEMLTPDKIASPVKYHGTRPWKTLGAEMSFSVAKVEVG